MDIRPLAPFVVAAALATAACSESGSTGPEEPAVSTITIDAAEGWGFAAFSGDLAVPVNVTDPSASSAWHVGLYATSVMLNGGDAGPGDAEGYCVCQNDGAGDAAIAVMTTEGELADFEAVTAADIPADDDAWASDVLIPAIQGWYGYDVQTHQVSAAPEKSWYVRTAAGDAFAKVHVIAIEDPSQAHAGTVTLEFAVQLAGAAEFGAPEELAIDLSAGAVYVDLDDGSTSNEATAGWDLRLEGYEIRVNGGASGHGDAGAGGTETPFDEIETASGVPDVAFAGDRFGGAFDEHAWYLYNIEGGHQIWPTYDVYLLRTGEDVYKVQLTSYYGPTGDNRQITFRYELLD